MNPRGLFRKAAAGWLLILAGCGGSGEAVEAGPTPLPPAPWSAPPLTPAAVPQVYLTVWSRAENRDRCALIAPESVEPASATVRSATFSGGWGVAYDLPDLRSAFGVAGTGVDAAGPTYDEWPRNIQWADGSTAGYGPEGGTGPNQLAYVFIPGQTCLYNVWSRIGVEHLERLLASLRFVDIPG